MSNSKSKKNKKIPTEKVEEHNKNINVDEKICFNFKYLDRKHELFNLGDTQNNPQSTEVGWYLDLLDCLSNVSTMTIKELKAVKTYDLHPINWNGTNVKCPSNENQYEWQQFRINKSKGRVIGFFIDNCFHIYWLDRHHNLTDSEGYGKAQHFKTPLSLYEEKEQEIAMLKEENNKLKNENSLYENLIKGEENI